MRRIIFLAVIILLIQSVIAEEEHGLELRWSYPFPDTVNYLNSYDLDQDNESEILVAAGKIFYILDLDGNLEKRYTARGDGSISSIAIGNMDNDSTIEILLATGWMERNLSSEPSFEMVGNERIDKERYLLRTTKDSGEIFLVDEKGVNKWTDASGWVKSIAIADLEDDGDIEIIVAAGGIDTEIYNQYGTWTEKIWICEERPYTEIEVCYWNETTREGWREDSISYASSNISVLHANASVRNSYLAEKDVWDMEVKDLYNDQDLETVLCFQDEVRALDYLMNSLWVYTVDDSPRRILIRDINLNEILEIAVAFRNPAYDGVILLDRNGRELWNYRIQDEFMDLWIENIDEREGMEIILASKNRIYILDQWGQLKLELRISKEINTLHTINLDEKDYQEILIASGGNLLVYGITEEFIKMENATQLYQLAKKYYIYEQYQKAGDLTREVLQIYNEINYSIGILEAESFLLDIEKGILRNKKIMADSLYKDALSEYAINHNQKALKLVNESKALYVEIGNKDGISLCNLLIIKIEEELVESTSTTPVSIPSTTISQGKDQGATIIPIAAIIIGITLAIIMLFIRSSLKK